MSATWGSVWALIGNAVKLYEDQRTSLSNTFVAQHNTMMATADISPYNAAAYFAALAGSRASFDAALRGWGGPMAPLIAELGVIIKAPEFDLASVVGRVFRYMVDNPDAIAGPPRIASREFVRPAWVNGSTFVGTGTVHRLLVDADGQPIENTFADLITGTVIADRQSGADVGRETWEFKGRPRLDSLDYYVAGKGSGLVVAMNSVSSDDSPALILNPSFGDIGGSMGALTDITNWTITSNSIANFDVVEGSTVTFRTALLEGTTPRALKVLASAAIQQKLSLNRGTIDPNTPYYCDIKFNKTTYHFIGELNLRLGTQNVNVTISSQSGWTTLKMPLDKNLYLKNWNEDDADLLLTITRGSTGSLLLDDVVISPFKAYDNQWILPVSGATPHLLNDNGSLTDSEIGSAKIQRSFHRAFARYLPSAPNFPAATAYASLAGAGAGNLNGAYTYKLTYRRLISDTDYVESGGASITNSVTAISGSNGQVNIANIPTGPSGTTQTRIYRTPASGSHWLLAGTVTTGSTTLWRDNQADGSLGQTLPSGIVILDPS